MGTHCCVQEFDNYEIKLQKKQIVEKRRRVGFPSLKIGIPMSDLNENVRKDDLKRVNGMVFKVVDYEKKFRRCYRVNQEGLLENRLNQVYYILGLDLFYVGEWVYDENVDDNVPWGIGRVYESHGISEGYFKSIFLGCGKDGMRQLEKTDVKYNLKGLKNEQNLDGSEIKREQKFVGFSKFVSKIKDNKDQNYLKLERKLKFVEDEEINKVKFVIKLHGQGRIYEKNQEEQEEIEMEGDFYEGLLNGRGSLKITKKGIRQYYYLGSWKNGERHGKGVEKMSNYKYQGNFKENSKEGKGIQTFISSVRDEIAIERDVKRMEEKMRNEEESMRIEVLKNIAIREYRQKMIKQGLDKEMFPGNRVEFAIKDTFFLDSSFIMERMYRRVFAESYSGDFDKGKMSGSGIYVWSTGKTYKGEWKDSKLNGKGEFYWAQGFYYQGGYVDDERYGLGTMVWSVNRRYRGSWAFGYRHGYGQSIEIDEKKGRMIVKGSIWDKDIVKKRIFKKVLELPYFNQTNQIQDYIQDEIGGVKDKRKKKDYGDVWKLESLKDIGQNHMVKQFDKGQGQSDVE